MLVTSLKRSVLQTARMGLVRRWMRRERTREKVAAVRRGVITRSMRKVTRAEEGYEEYEEGDPDAEEGYEEVWDEVQEALSTMEHEEFDETAEADLCARSQASRPSSASSQASVRS